MYGGYITNITTTKNYAYNNSDNTDNSLGFRSVDSCSSWWLTTYSTCSCHYHVSDSNHSRGKSIKITFISIKILHAC